MLPHPSRARSKTIANSLSVLQCDVCGTSFGTLQALSVHRSRTHLEICEARRFLRGTRCDVCGLECHSRYHLIEHGAHKSQICLHNYHLRDCKLTPAEVDALDLAERQRIHTCRLQSKNPRKQPSVAYRSSLPTAPVLRPDGAWLPGDPGHPLGPNRRLLLLTP